jgi:hypothetical protein
MGKYGTNQTGLAAYEGGVNNDKGSPLVANNTDGETALLFGPAALREIQTLVANGDFSISPDQASDNITDENPLPYWTVTTTGSTCSAAIVADSDAASGQVLQITVGAGSGGSLTLTRYIPIPGTRGQTFCVNPILTMGSASNVTDAELYATGRQVNAAGSFVGSTVTLPTYQFNSYTGVVENLLPDVDQFTTWVDTAVQPSAAFYKISITFQNVGTTAASRTIKVFDVRLVLGSSDLTIAESTTPGTYGPAYIRQEAGVLNITANTAADSLNGLAVTTDGITVTGNITGDGVTTDLKHGITLQRTTNLTVNTSLDASATAITWSSAVKNTSLYAYWSSGSTIAIPLTGWYSITCHLISGTGLGTGFAFRLYALVNGTVIAETETQAGANTSSDTFSISTIAYMTAADSLVFRASASAASKTIGGSRRSACSVVYLGNTSA